MAFQPIIDLEGRSVFAHEALVRGPNGEGAGWVLAQVDDKTRYAFDQTCRVTAIEEAAQLGVHRDGAMVSINFLPNAVYEPANCIRATLRAAERAHFPLTSIMFEVTEAEEVRDTDHLSRIIASYKEMGFTVAIDDFGAGFAGLSLLSDFRPDLVKLDMKLVRGVDADARRRAICRGVINICRDLGIRVIAEGIETEDELSALRDLGISLVQGYLFAKPKVGSLHRLASGAPR
jgi:EAL domain-containing protein (putative c-di-GMP-specific phosphodiesterase class I)